MANPWKLLRGFPTKISQLVVPKNDGTTRDGEISKDFFFRDGGFLICWIFIDSVAMTPAVAATLIKKGFNVNVESGAGFEAKFRDEDYIQAGAKIVDSKGVYNADILLKVRQPTNEEVPLLKPESTLISFLYPAQNKELINELAKKKINAFGKAVMIFFS